MNTFQKKIEKMDMKKLSQPKQKMLNLKTSTTPDKKDK